MKRVLIVDDELLVRMGFRSILDWESCGFTVVGDAENGEEALEKIRVLKPDLVFTDLKMDRMDGFELMNACMRDYPSVKFIVLSGYNDFENVRQAMRCGALDYVFKLDVTPEQLRKILSEIKWETPEPVPVGQSGRRAMRASAVRRAIAGEIPPEEARESFARMFPAVRWERPFRLITVAIDDSELRRGNAHQRLSQSAIVEIESICEEVFAEQAVVCPFQADRALMIWQQGSVEALSSLQSAYARAEEYVKRYLNQSVTAVISESHPNLRALPQAHLQNEETLSYRYLLDHGRIHGYHPVAQPDSVTPPIDMSALDAALAGHNGEHLSAACEAAFSQMSKRRGYPLHKLRVNLLDMLFAIKRVYPTVAAWTDENGYTLANLIQRSDRLSTVREGFAKAVAQCTGEKEARSLRPEIQMIVRYVREHPAQELSVSGAAQLARLSESYFAHIFKREMGMSFVDWYNRERIERARQLLCQSDMRVNEIAASVGIDNANYFSILFKKLTGKTPMQVRDEAKKQNREGKSGNRIV